MVVQFANAEVFGDHSYNNNVVDRYTSISVNGGSEQVIISSTPVDGIHTVQI